MKDWLGSDHPFYDLADLIEKARCMLVRRRRTPASATRYLLRIVALLPWFERHVVGSHGRLVPIATRLKKATRTANAEDAGLLLEEAGTMLASIIVADEDAKYPGCRTEEGEVVAEKPRIDPAYYAD